jgi:hypothetical protein
MIELGAALREKAPRALVGAQPWPWILSHAGLRKTAAPLRAGGVLRGFPLDELVAHVQWGLFRQLYWEDWREALAYLLVTERSDRDYAAIAPALRALLGGIERPLRVTLQGYAHDRDPHYFVDALLHYMVELQQPVIVWCEPFPPPLTIAMIRAVQLLVRDGFALPGRPSRDAVRAWQQDHNRLAPQDKKVEEDGLLGREGPAGPGAPAGVATPSPGRPNRRPVTISFPTRATRFD